jgi:peptidyl-prolyl cis-trans isomerase C
MVNYSKQSDNKRANYLFSIFCILLFLTAYSLSCRSKKPSDVNEAEPNVAVEPVLEDTAVTVNGIEIGENQVDTLVDAEFERIASKAAQLPPAFAEQFKKQLRQQALERLIAEQLLLDKVREAEIEIADDEVEGYIEKVASEQSPPLSLEELKARIASQSGGFDQMKQQIRRGLGYQKLMESQWAGKINITAEDAQKYYTENQKEFETPEQVRASHILIKPDLSDPSKDPNEAQALARAKAEDLLRQIKEGADFAELAKTNSDCPSSKNGGDLDFFVRGDMVPDFENAAFKLQPGQVSDIVQTKFGYHIIKVTDHKDGGIPSFEQIKDDLIQKLIRNKKAEITQQYIQSLKEKANIIYPPGKEPQSDTMAPTVPNSTTGR